MEKAHRPRWANVWGFFTATYALAWLIWLLAILWGGEEPPLALVVLGAFAPSTMGILFTYLTHDRDNRRAFWRRVVSVRRIGWRWGLVILLVFPVVHGISMVTYALLGGSPPSLADASQTLVSPGLMLQIVVANLIISGFSEELGWRGYALDPLQARWGALRASLLLGLVHSLWHLPLFFIPGLTQGEIGLFSLGALVFMAGGPAGAVIFTWVYNNTRRSILSAALLHFMINLCLDVLLGLQAGLPTGYSAVYTGVLLLLDVGIAIGWGARTLRRRPRPVEAHQAPAV